MKYKFREGFVESFVLALTEGLRYVFTMIMKTCFRLVGDILLASVVVVTFNTVVYSHCYAYVNYFLFAVGGCKKQHTVL